MPHTSSLDVAIVGAGPVGMTLAAELTRHGLAVRIVDKAPHPKPYSRAPVIWPRVQEALDLMGLHRLWDGRTVPMTHIHLNVYGRPVGVLPLTHGESPHPTPMMVGQDVTEQLLSDHLTRAGAPVEYGVEATAVEPHDGGVRVTLRKADGSEESVDAAWAVGCDGPKSLVRDAARIAFEGRQLQGMMVPIADAKVTRWPLSQAEGQAYIGLTDRGYFLALPLPGMQRIIVSTPDTTPEGEEPTTTLDEVARLMSEILGGPVELADSPWTTVARYTSKRAAHFRAGRVFVAGDAAHSIAPLSGQGMNVGIQDAFDLAWKLAYVHKGWAPDGLLDSFMADRKPVAERLLQATERFFDVTKEPGAAQKALFRATAPAALALESVREHVAAFYTETESRYADSPLNDAQHGRQPVPGEHVPDGDLVRWPDLGRMRVFDALRGLHWTALAFTGAAPSAAAVQHLHAHVTALVRQAGDERLRPLLVVGAPQPPVPFDGSDLAVAIDAWQDVHDKYDAGDGALVLVRPDGYVAFHRGIADADFAAAADYVQATLGAPAGAAA